MSFEFIKTETQKNTEIITFNRPECYNAFNVQTKLEVIKAIKAANKNTEVRSIILTGQGKAFCSGQDLNDRTVNSDHGPVDIGKTLRDEWNPLIETIRASEKLVIGALNGVCAGAGLSVAMACDFKVSAPGVKFVSGFAQIGLAPDAGMSHTLVRAMGYSRALQFSLFGERLEAHQMLDFKLINEISDNPLDSSLEWSQKINQLAPLSVKMIKKNLQTAQDQTFDQVIWRETYTQRYLGFSNDYSEGVKAFFEKRSPKFQGQ